jgi:hypothetical protein
MHIPSFVFKIWCRPCPLWPQSLYYQRTYPSSYIDDDDHDELVEGNEDGAMNVVVAVNWRKIRHDIAQNTMRALLQPQ